MFGKRIEIQYLKARVTELLAERDRERLRADRAVDELLRLSGKAPVSEAPPALDPSSFDGLFVEDPEEVRALKQRLETEETTAVLLEAAGGIV